MRVTLSDEQRLIQASALEWLDGNYDFRRRAAGVHRNGGAAVTWKAFADMGWLGLPLSEEVGGVGAGMLEAGLLMQAFGRHLVVEPFHGCVLQAARLLDLAGDARQRSQWLPAVVEGSARLALAHAEPGDALPWEPRRTVARRTDKGWHIRGAKQLAIGAQDAARWVVSASDDEGPHEHLFLVDPTLEGIELDAYDTTDGGRAADIELDVTVDAGALMARADAGSSDLLRRVLAEGVIAQCWEASGAMQAALEQTTQYTQQRKQFGQSLSTFQVVQHRLAEMAVHCLESQAACELATMGIAQDPGEGPLMAAMAKNKVARAARFVAQEAVQLHGAMGVCEELPIAATFRMLLAFCQCGGDPASHAQYLGAQVRSGGAYANSQTLGVR